MTPRTQFLTLNLYCSFDFIVVIREQLKSRTTSRTPPPDSFATSGAHPIIPSSPIGTEATSSLTMHTPSTQSTFPTKTLTPSEPDSGAVEASLSCRRKSASTPHGPTGTVQAPASAVASHPPCSAAAPRARKRVTPPLEASALRCAPCMQSEA